MAQVFKAKTVDPTGTERLVVIKRILPHISAQPEYVEMLIDEAKIAVHFTHGNIAQVYDLGRVGEDYFIVMEYVDGRTLSQINKALIERHQKIPFDILLYCFIELCHGLSYIHRKTGPTGKPLGVVHRDVSPQNIILSYAGNVKIIDFGVARADFLESRTEQGVLKGKFAYMSPEQTFGEKIDHRSDIFSIGTLLWEMATGERLFKRQNNQDTIKAVQKAKFNAPSERRADVPKALDKIVKKALSRSPRQRYQDANDMAVDLEKLLFLINPDFRPVSAAKFLYDLFGPAEDEANLPPPFFVKPSEQKERGLSQHTGKSQNAGVMKIDEEPTIREPVVDETTPMVKIPRRFGLKTRGGIIAAIIILIFVFGSLYVTFIHALNKKAYLKFVGLDPAMHLILNGQAVELPQEEMTLASNTNYQIKITRDGYNDYIRQIKLDPRQHSVVTVKMEVTVPPFGDLTVETTPPGATVSLDGKEWDAKTPVTLKNLNTGQKYQIRIALSGYTDVNRDVDIAGGKEIKISLPLAINYAQLVVDSVPQGAAIYIDDSQVGVTPYKVEMIPGVERRIKVSLKGFADEVETLKLDAGEVRDLKYELKAATELMMPIDLTAPKESNTGTSP